MSIRDSKNGSLLTAALLAFLLLAFFSAQKMEANKSLAQHQSARLLAFFSSYPDLSKLSEGSRALTLVFGQSELETSFDPHFFDSLLAETASPTQTYNLATRFMGPELYSLFAKMYRARGGPRARYIFYNLPTFSLTTNYARTMGTQLGHLPLLLEWARFASLKDLTSGPYLTSLRDLFTIQPVEWGAIIRLPPSRLLPGQQERRRLFDTYISYWSDPAHSDSAPWRTESRGKYEFKRTAEEASFFEKEFRHPEMRQSIAAAYENCCGILKVDFSSARLDELARTNADLLEISEQVVFLDLREAPSVLRLRKPPAFERLEKAKSILRGKGVKIWEVDAGCTEEDYSDGIHLSASGSDKLHRWLAARILKEVALSADKQGLVE